MGPRARLAIRTSFSPHTLVTITTELSRLLSDSHIHSVLGFNSYTELQGVLLCFPHRPCSWQENVTLSITESGWERRIGFIWHRNGIPASHRPPPNLVLPPSSGEIVCKASHFTRLSNIWLAPSEVRRPTLLAIDRPAQRAATADVVQVACMQ